MVAFDRQCWGNSQYFRRECLETTGVPDSISNNDLEETTLKIFDKLDHDLLILNTRPYMSHLKAKN